MVKARAKPVAKPVAKARPAVAPVAAAPAKAKRVLATPLPTAKAKAKLVRDSFTMPQADFDLIAVLKDRALGFKRPTKKSELLRAGLQALAALQPAELQDPARGPGPAEDRPPQEGQLIGGPLCLGRAQKP